MSAMVSIGWVNVGAATNGTGVFNGQNMQNDWDSHAPSISSSGDIAGNWGRYFSVYTILWNINEIGQPIVDSDTKMNNNRILIGP